MKTVLAFAALAALPFLLPSVSAAEFDISAFGATADDATDDTKAINAALAACGDAGGGVVIVPKGTFVVSRQGSESPILEVPSNTTVCGRGDGSILKYSTGVNKSNFWRMLGAGKSCRDITIRDLHLDGSNVHKRYVKGETSEQNHGVFFYSKTGPIENVTVADCLLENFSGDCVSFSKGCRNFTIRNLRLRNFLRQGVQMGGGPGDGGHLVTGCRDLKHTVAPGGSTIHVEHAEGAGGFRIIGNRCRQSLLAGGGADRLVVRENQIEGRIEGNSIKNGLFQSNHLLARTESRPMMQFGYADGLTIRDNTVIGGDSSAIGIYIWGTSRYNPAPSRDVVIQGNVLEVKGQPILLNGVQGAQVRDNVIKGSTAELVVKEKRTKDIVVAHNRTEGIAEQADTRE
jgi:hypothetical protein